MNRNLSKRPKVVRKLSKRPKVVRKLDGALTAWRYFHGPNFVYDVRARPRFSAFSVYREENEALFAILVAFVKWMQAPISPWAGSPFVEFVDETGTMKAERRPIGIWLDIETRIAGASMDVALQTHRDSGRLPEPPKTRSDIARFLSTGRPNSPFYLIGEKPLGKAPAGVPKFFKAPR